MLAVTASTLPKRLTRRALLLLPLCALALVAAAPSLPPDPELVRLTRLWSENRYADALPGLLRYRLRGTDARYRNEDVDFMIATSTCRLPATADLGLDALTKVLALYRLDAPGRALVQEEIGRGCPPRSGRLVRLDLNRLRERAAVTERSAVTLVRGKMAFDPASADQAGPVGSENIAAPATGGPSATDLEARLFTPDRVAQAISSARRLALPGSHVVGEGMFVLASSSHSEAGLRSIGRRLGQYLDYYSTHFSMRRPPYLITVYLAPDVGKMRDLGRRVHGLDISTTSIGYSVHDDLSIVAWVPEDFSGTLAHELFHLAVREDFGDVPAWLDEGVAALYEVSELGKGEVRGLPNWRGPILSTRFDSRPSVAKLVAADWVTFDALEGTRTQQAVNHATARYFALYLQETGRLPDVYRAFRARDIFARDAEAANDPVRVLERATGQSASALDAAFTAWFRTVHG